MLHLLILTWLRCRSYKNHDIYSLGLTTANQTMSIKVIMRFQHFPSRNPWWWRTKAERNRARHFIKQVARTSKFGPMQQRGTVGRTVCSPWQLDTTLDDAGRSRGRRRGRGFLGRRGPDAATRSVDDVGVPQLLDMETVPDQAKRKGCAMVRRKRRTKDRRSSSGSG